MSFWTHIVAAIDVDTYIKDVDLKTRVETLLKDAPKITGSEKNADVFVNVLSGHNWWTSGDCNICEFGDTVIHLEDGCQQCDSPADYRCPSGEYQTRIVITVIGDLRDRMRDQTKTEWFDFKKFISKNINGNGFTIRNYSWKILG